MALLAIKNDIHLSLYQGEANALVLLDILTAIDTIDHSTLHSCLLDWFGVGGSILKWFSSYLIERFQSVKIGSTLSDLQKLLSKGIAHSPKEYRRCGFNPRYRQIHSGSGDHLKWWSSVIGSYPQWKVKEPQGH